MNGLNSKADTSKDRICKLENYDEITQNAANRETSRCKTQEKFTDIKNIMKKPDIGCSSYLEKQSTRNEGEV